MIVCRCLLLSLLLLAGFPSFSSAAQPPEFRALWVDTFHAAMRTSGEVTALVNQARTNNFNAIIVEVRKRCDAYYNSNFEPKASDVSPQSFDPLADLLNKAHNGGRRIEVHAWMTTYLVWNNRTTGPPQTNHPYYQHPEWLSRDVNGETWDGGNYQFDQSHPEVQKHVHNVALDIVSRYAVDGLHFDYVRFSGRDWGYHPVAVQRFNARFNRTGTPAVSDPQWLQFRRDQVSDLVRKVYLNSIAVRPQVKISAATITWGANGVRNDAEWFSSAEAWNSVLQDWRGWLQEGILDLAVPMTYYDHRRYPSAWTNWSTFAKEHAYSRHVAIGHGSYLNTLSNGIHQLRTTRDATPNSNAVASGFAMYSYAVPGTNVTRAQVFYAMNNSVPDDPHPVPMLDEPVATPIMPWKATPTLGHLRGTIRAAQTSNELDGAIVSISGPRSGARTNDATGFYGFVDLPSGTYSVTATYSNLASQTATVQITAGTVATLNFLLAPTNALPPPETGIVNLRVSPGAHEALFAWTTTNASDSQVEFGPTPALGSSSWRDSQLVTNHVVLVSGLSANTDYFFRVVSRAGGLTLTSAVYSFTTAGDLIVDNPSATLSGSWTLTAFASDRYGSNYVYAGTLSPPATATFTPEIATPGLYDVYVWYSQGGNRSAVAPFAIAHQGGSVTGQVNQTTGGGGWRLVASALPFARGTNGHFQWRNQTGESSKVVIADAVRFAYAAGQETPAPGAVPLWWSEFYFGGPVNAALDHDGDGFTTAEEFVAGTHPLNGASRLRYEIQDRASNLVRTTFSPYHAGRSYHHESQTTLNTNDWSASGSSPQALPNGDGSFSITNSGAGRGFYRLRVQLSP